MIFMIHENHKLVLNQGDKRLTNRNSLTADHKNVKVMCCLNPSRDIAFNVGKVNNLWKSFNYFSVAASEKREARTPQKREPPTVVGRLVHVAQDTFSVADFCTHLRVVSLDLCSIVSKVMLGWVRLEYGGVGAFTLG